MIAMRIIVPIFEEWSYKLAIAEWEGRTILEATLKALKKANALKLIVISCYQEVLEIAKAQGIKSIESKEPLRGQENYLPPGSMNALQYFKSQPPEKTLLLWHPIPWIDKDFLDSIEENIFYPNHKMSVSIQPCREHPCQMYEGFDLHTALVFIPVSKQTRGYGHISRPFPFDWMSRNVEKGERFFKRIIHGNQIRYSPVSDPRDNCSTCRVWEKIDHMHARIHIPYGSNEKLGKEGERLEIAAVKILQGKEFDIELLRDKCSNELHLSIGEQNLKNTNFKFWSISPDGLKPMLINGISLEEKDPTLIPVPSISMENPVLVWVTQTPQKEGCINAQLFWDSDVGGWHRGKNMQPVRNDNNEQICGRQAFPPVYQPDGQAALFAPGFIPVTEPSLDSNNIGVLKLKNRCPYVIQQSLDIIKTKIFYKNMGHHVC